MHRMTLSLALLLASSAGAQDRLRVVGTLPDLVDIARQVGGERIEAESIAVGYQDPHFVDPKPSFVVLLNRADVFIQVGLDLEIGWVPPLLNQSRNGDIQQGGPGWIDASEGVAILERPTRAVSRAEGDIHVYGNPHYWLDPLNGKIVAAHIERVFSRLRPEWSGEFRANLERFERRIDESLARWQSQLAPHRGHALVAYHNSWPYFTKRFGLEIAGFLEPKPGIPPTPQDLVRVIAIMRRGDTSVLAHSVYLDDKPVRFITEKTRAEIVTLANSVGALEGVDDYFDLFDVNIELLVSAFERTELRGR